MGSVVTGVVWCFTRAKDRCGKVVCGDSMMEMASRDGDGRGWVSERVVCGFLDSIVFIDQSRCSLVGKRKLLRVQILLVFLLS